MRVEGELTQKGERRALEILDATLRCLARDGYAATSLQRVADEAGLQKRIVLYYYGSREASSITWSATSVTAFSTDSR